MKEKFIRVYQFFFSSAMWFFAVCATILAASLILLVHRFDPGRKRSQKIAACWGKTIVGINPLWRLDIKGKENLSAKSAVLVANHKSLADIVCLYCAVDDFKWVAKESLFKIPFLGWAMAALEYIPLKRGARGSIRDTMEKARSLLARGESVLFFPEGTRSRTGKLGPFKSGAFKLAIETKRPILPIVISGTETALRKGALMVGANVNGKLKILAAVDVQNFEPDRDEELRDFVWKLMEDELAGDTEKKTPSGF